MGHTQRDVERKLVEQRADDDVEWGQVYANEH
jgi:hypothetical protein